MGNGEQRRHARLAALAVFAVSFAYFALFVRYGFNVDDEGTLLAEFYRTYRGEIPYRDFHVGYTPGGHYFQALLLHLFGVSVVPLRWFLAGCHGTVAMLLFAIGRRMMPLAFALLAPLVYCATMPFYPGEFASFNIAYPAWYTVLFSIAGFWALLRAAETDRLAWFAVSGLTAGLCFSFKPNVGLFQLASAGLVFLLAHEPPVGGRAARFQGALWWLLAVGIATGLALVFGLHVPRRDFAIFLLPIVVVIGVLAARRLAGRSTETPAHGLLAAGAVYFVALMAMIVPWALVFLRILGRERFARQVLFIGAGFESHYYLPFHLAGPWDAALVVGAAGLVIVGLLQRARLVPVWLVPAGATVAAVVAVSSLWHAEMPEGLRAAVVSRTEDLSFTTTLLVHWGTLVVALPVLWRRTRSPQERTRLVVLVAALAMYLQLYPRSDFMHVIAAMPLTLVLGAALAAGYAAWFDATPVIARGVRIALVSGTLAFVGLRIAPNLSSVLTWNGGPAWRPLAALDLAPAPLVLEMGRAPRFRELEGVVSYLRANTAPDEAVFSFPAIELVCFLAERPQATRRGHFFPGWPGHDVEAEVVSDLKRTPPRLAVVLHDHQLYFVTAPAYYYALREFVQANYRQVASFGHYAVLAHRDVLDAELRAPTPLPASTTEEIEARYGAALRGLPEERLNALRAIADERLDFPWEPVAALLDDPDRRVRAAAVWALNDATDPGVALALARALLRNAVPPAERQMALRRIQATVDVRTTRPLLEMLPDLFHPPERALVLSSLYALGNKLAIASYWFGDPPLPGRLSGRLPGVGALRRQLANPDADLRLRVFLAWFLPSLHDDALVPALNVAFGSDLPVMRSAAAAGLLRLGVTQAGLDPLELVLPLVAREPTFAPSVALALYRRDPSAARRPLARALGTASSPDQEALAWLVSAIGDRHFRVPLVRLLLSPERGVRLAALAGLERIADPRTRPALLRAASDSDYEVRAFAGRALAALPPQS